MHTIQLAKISFHADEAVYLQLADHLRRTIALGQIKTGARLPSIRETAVKLGLDPGTVARAYRELEREGSLAGRRGGGTVVMAAGKNTAQPFRQKLDAVMDRAIMEGLGLGFATEEIGASFSLRLANWRERRDQSARARTSRKSATEVRFQGSHDLAVEMLATHLGAVTPGLKFSTTFDGSLAGLLALSSREADFAGTHLLDDESGEYNIPFIKRLMPHDRVSVMNLIQRYQGLMVAPGNPRRIQGIEDLARPGVTYVNRQKGSGTRLLLDASLLRIGVSADDIKGYEHEEKTHLAVASLISQGKADAGLGAQSAAIFAGLGFIPLVKERYDLVVLQDALSKPSMRKVQEVVRGRTFRNMLKSIPGCDASETGVEVIVSPE